MNRIVLILLVVACVAGLTAMMVRSFQEKSRDTMGCIETGGVIEYQKVGDSHQMVCAWRPAPDRVLR